MTLFLQDVENIHQSSESLIFRHYPTTVMSSKNNVLYFLKTSHMLSHDGERCICQRRTRPLKIWARYNENAVIFLIMFIIVR